MLDCFQQYFHSTSVHEGQQESWNEHNNGESSSFLSPLNHIKNSWIRIAEVLNDEDEHFVSQSCFFQSIKFLFFGA